MNHDGQTENVIRWY